jgi:hypothetical protein
MTGYPIRYRIGFFFKKVYHLRIKSIILERNHCCPVDFENMHHNLFNNKILDDANIFIDLKKFDIYSMD